MSISEIDLQKARDVLKQHAEEVARKELEEASRILIDLGFGVDDLVLVADGNNPAVATLKKGVVVSPEQVKISVNYLRVLIERCKTALESIQSKCQHEDKVTDTWNDDNGWDKVKINWYESVVCKICGRSAINHTGTERY